mgnify:FL=1
MTKQIKLDTGIEINGTTVKVLTMREPTVADQLSADEIKGSDALKEITIFANLCEISPDEIKQMTMKDYRKLQEAYRDFS